MQKVVVGIRLIVSPRARLVCRNFRVAHLVRLPRAGKRMASKVHLMKFLQEVRGYDLVTNRRPPPRFSGMFSLQMRSRMAETGAPARRKLAISVHPADVSNTPSPVKILQVAVR